MDNNNIQQAQEIIEETLSSEDDTIIQEDCSEDEQEWEEQWELEERERRRVYLAMCRMYKPLLENLCERAKEVERKEQAGMFNQNGLMELGAIAELDEHIDTTIREMVFTAFEYHNNGHRFED